MSLMKKLLLTLCLALTLVCACVLPALAQDGSPMYLIVCRENGADTPIATGIVFLQQDVLLAPENCRGENLIAIGDGGEIPVAAVVETGNSGAVLLQLSRNASATPAGITDYNTDGENRVHCAAPDGEMGMVSIYDAIYSQYRGRSAIMLSLEEGLLPGACWLDVDGCLIAMAVAQNGEGLGMYTAVDATHFADLTFADVRQGGEHFLPFTMRYADGLLHITWEKQKRQSGMYFVYISGEENSYYNTYTVGRSQSECIIALPTGTTWDVQVQWAENNQSAHKPMWLFMQSIHIPTGPAYRDYGYRQECYIVIEPAGADLSGHHAQDAIITVDQLNDRNLTAALQINSHYDVDGEVELPLVTALYTPDGQVYFTDSESIFAPEYEADDAFAIELADLFADSAAFSPIGKMQSGQYTVKYELGGRIGGSTTFTVAPAGTEIPADVPEPTGDAGLVTAVTLTQQPGRVLLDWSKDSCPRGEDVQFTLVFMFEGNVHYMSRQFAGDATLTEILTLPDRTLAFWLVWTKNGADPMSCVPQKEGDFFQVKADGVQPCTLNGFTHVDGSLTIHEPIENALRMETLITRELLATNPTIYFQTADRYRVDADDDDHPCLITLYTPEGYAYISQGMYTFMAELCDGDIWARDITGLFEDYLELNGTGEYASGEYRVVYTIDGFLAGETAFTLE